MRNPFRRRRGRHSTPLGNYSGVFLSVRTRKRTRFGWLRRKWVWIPLLIALVLGGMAGYALWYYYSLQGDVQVDIPVVTPPEDEEEPFNALLVGSDSREGLTEEEQTTLGAQDVTVNGVVGGERADTLILAHVDPEANRVTMVQFPRDLYVPMATGGSNKINSALEGGRTALVKTVEELTGLDINVYAQVNIAGFRDLVNAIDGVEVCVPEPIPFDTGTGIEVPPEEVGMVHFDGERALRFVRARKVFGEGDFARIQNQQKFLAAAIDKITSPSTFLSLRRLLHVKDAAGKNLKIDSNTSLPELYRLMRRFRSFDPERYEAYTVPNLGVATNEAGSVVLPDEGAMKAMFHAIAENQSPEVASTAPNGVDPATIRLAVYNGADHDDVIAGPARDALEEATEIGGSRIDVAEVDLADREGYRQTVIRYERDSKKKANFIAAAIPGAKLKRADVGLGLDLEVIVGERFETQRLFRLKPLELPVAGDLPQVCE
ncbi:MAG: LCP family protein [Actinomycetota bacterium]|nr:LCP family protein [Actinomycetota bacterium]